MGDTLQTVKGKNAERLQMLLQSCMRLRIYLSWMREDTVLLNYSIIDRHRVLKMQYHRLLIYMKEKVYF